MQTEDFNSIIIGCKISYINQIYDPKERMDILKFLENGLKSFKLEEDFFEKGNKQNDLFATLVMTFLFFIVLIFIFFRKFEIRNWHRFSNQ